MKLLIAAAIAAGTIAITGAAGAVNGDTGMDLWQRCRADWRGEITANHPLCAAYIAGFAGGLGSVRKICPPFDSGIVGVDQLGLVANEWMRSHPGQLSRSANSILRDALIDAFPCR